MVDIRLSRSIVGPAEAEAVQRVLLEDGYLGMGREISALAAFIGVSPSSVALRQFRNHLAVEAALDPGSEVLVPPLTYVASYQAIAAARAVPVSCDVTEDQRRWISLTPSPGFQSPPKR
jgi:dTDP-4-amino-4,6-dideoxygalactose transaminase